MLARPPASLFPSASSAVADKATVPIYYESRIAKLGLNAAELPKLDAEFEEITEGEELTHKEKLKTKWAALEALVGDPKRIALIAADLVTHFEKRLEAMDGKAMVVGMSRRICVDLPRKPGTNPATPRVMLLLTPARRFRVRLLATRKGKDRGEARSLSFTLHHFTRRTRFTASKCVSRLTTGGSCCNAGAATVFQSTHFKR